MAMMNADSTRENRSMSDPTSGLAGVGGKRRARKERRASGKGLNKERTRGAGGRGGDGRSSSVIVMSKEAKRELIRKHKKDELLLEYDSYVPPQELVRCMKKVIAMMEKDKGVTRWYKKKRGRILEACPWNRYYPAAPIPIRVNRLA